MKLWRLDAEHERDDADGALCLFFMEEVDAHIRERGLIACGWMTDVYLDDIGPMTGQEIGRIVGGPWPLVPSDVVLDLVRSAVLEVLEAEQMDLDEAHL